MPSNLSSKLSYELPSHPIGEHHEALLSKTNTLFQLISLNDMGIDFLPEVIILGDCRYRYAGVEYGRGIYRQEDEVLLMPPVPASEPTPVSALMHNDLHNPAYMQCEKCRILAEKLAEMLENPPGFEGIKVDGEHYGNKWIDYGWQEAVRVVQSLIVQYDYGTTPETVSSLVENPDVPQEKR